VDPKLLRDLVALRVRGPDVTLWKSALSSHFRV
jgi:hypothetical protein